MENPVLLKEIRTRTRSRKSRKIVLAVGIPALLLGLFCYIRLLVAMADMGRDNGEIWIAASMLQLTIICFIVPGLLSNAVSQEREQRTWGLLLITRLTHGQIVAGKLIARLLPIPILMLIFVPFMIYSAVSAHMRFWPIALTYLLLVACAAFFAVQAFFWSWLFRRTAIATAAAYGTVFFVTVGTLILEGLSQAVGSYDPEPSLFLRANPFFALGEYLDKAFFNSGADPGPVLILSIVYLGVSALLSVIMLGDFERTGAE